MPQNPNEKRQIGFGDWYPGKNLKKYLADILKTRRLTYGKYCEKLEKLFGQINGTKYNIFCSSGTAALYTALGVLKNMHPERARERQVVIMPATTFISDVNVIVMNGFKPVFVDVGPNYNISYTDLESKLRDNFGRVFAVMPSSLMGRPVDGAKIRSIINDYGDGAFFVLDSCENISSKYAGEYPESFAEFTAWSTYISHLLISGACGGFIGTNDEKLAIHARSFINHGRWHGYTNIDQDDNVDEATLRDITTNRFKFVQNGLNFRMGEVEAVFALSMLEDDFEGQLKKRNENANELIKRLSKFELVLPKFKEEEEVRHMMLPIRVMSGTKWDLVHFLEKEGVETRDILPLAGHNITDKYFGSLVNFRANFPMSWEIYEKGFYIASHQFLSKEDIDYIVNVFEKFFKQGK